MKKSSQTVLWVIIIIIVLVGVYFLFKGSTSNTAFTSGCAFIPNVNDPSLSYTDSVTSSSYTCTGGDECIVWGSMDVVKPSNPQAIPIVTFRTDDFDYGKGWIAIDINGDGILEGLQYKKYGSSSVDLYDSLNSPIINIPTGDGRNYQGVICKDSTCYNMNRGDVIIGTFGDTTYIYSMPSSTAITSNQPVAGYADKEVYASNSPNPLKYSANFNFCPTNDLNNAYCNKLYTSTSASTIFTSSNPRGSSVDAGAVDLANGASINFAPSYTDQSLGAVSHTLYIAKCDKSCSNSANTCVAGTQQCQQCPSGYFVSGDQCRNNVGNQVSMYSSYLTCTGTHIVGNYGAICPWWNEATISCGTGNQCYLGTTGKNTGVGVGSCRCATDECGSGQIKVNTDGTWQNCYQPTNSQCWLWNPTIHSCAQGLVFDGTKCVCDSTAPDKCDPAIINVRCNSNGFQKCLPITISDAVFGSIICNKWSSTITSCGNGQTCTNGKCNCDSQCSDGTIKCDGYSKKIPCNLYGSNSCKDFSGTSIDVGTGNQCVTGSNGLGTITTLPGCQYNPSIVDVDHNCVNNVIVPKTSPSPYCVQGTIASCVSGVTTKISTCSQITGTDVYKLITSDCPAGQSCFGGICYSKQCTSSSSPNYVACDTTNFESCISNVCTCAIDVNACTATDYTLVNTRCSADGIPQNCVKHGNCYRWENGISCDSNSQCVST